MNANVLVSTRDMSREIWLEYRKRGIGGSDVAAACGLSRWKSPLEVWMEKTGWKEAEPAGEAAYWGTVMEPIIREEFTRRTGLAVTQLTAILQHRKFSYMLANLDGIVVDSDRGKGIFEAKTASAYMADKWEAGIPDEYALQVQHYLAVTGLSFVYIAVLIGGNNFLWKLIERDDAVIDLIIQLEHRFWKLVQSKTPPQIDGSQASTELLRRLYPTSKAKTSIALPPEALDLIQKYELAQEEEKIAANKKDESANRLKELLGEKEVGTIEDRLVTWKTINSEKLDTKQLKAEQPDIHKQYVKKSSYRRFAIK